MKKLSTLLGLSLIALLSLCLFGCPNGLSPEEIFVTATEEGLAFDLSKFTTDVSITIENPLTGNAVTVYGPEKDFVYPYVKKGTTYTVSISGDSDKKQNVTATAGKGELFIKSSMTYNKDTTEITISYETDNVAPEKIEPHATIYSPNGVKWICPRNGLLGLENPCIFSLLDLPSVGKYVVEFIEKQLIEDNCDEIDFIITVDKYYKIPGARSVIASDLTDIGDRKNYSKYSKPETITKPTATGLDINVPSGHQLAAIQITEYSVKKEKYDDDIEYIITVGNSDTFPYSFPFVEKDKQYRIRYLSKENGELEIVHQEKVTATAGQGHKEFDYDIYYDNTKKTICFRPAPDNNGQKLVQITLDMDGFKLISMENKASTDAFSVIVDGTGNAEIPTTNIVDPKNNNAPLDWILNEVLSQKNTTRIEFEIIPTFAFAHESRPIIVTNYAETRTTSKHSQ